MYQKQEDEDNKELIGCAVKKFFPGYGHFVGRVVSYNKESKFFRVKYEDGDREELELNELREIVVTGQGNTPAKRSRGRPRKTEGSRKVLNDKETYSVNLLEKEGIFQNKQHSISNEDIGNGELEQLSQEQHCLIDGLEIDEQSGKDALQGADYAEQQRSEAKRRKGRPRKRACEVKHANGRREKLELHELVASPGETPLKSSRNDAESVDAVEREEVLQIDQEHINNGTCREGERVELMLTENASADMNHGEVEQVNQKEGIYSNGLETPHTSKREREEQSEVDALEGIAEGQQSCGESEAKRRKGRPRKKACRQSRDEEKQDYPKALTSSAKPSASLMNKASPSGAYSLRRNSRRLQETKSPIQPELIEDRKRSQEKEVCQHDIIRDLNILPLPPSSVNFNLPADSVMHLFSVYTFLRSFSWVIFLSPFSFEEFIQCLVWKEPNTLVDQIHLSMLLLLRQHLEKLAKDGVESAANCLRCRDWKLLDVLTWPSYMVTYLLSENYSAERREKLGELGILKGEYYGLEVRGKIGILSFICDRVLDTDEVRTELSKRTNVENEMDIVEAKTNPLCNRIREDVNLELTPKYRTRSSSKCIDSPDVEKGVTSEEIPPDTLDATSGGSMRSEQVRTPDWNSDDCVLCGMDGNLICCDGCPAAYHSRCVGVSKSAIPEGDWYCPECTIERSTRKGRRPSKGLRGFELLGVDLYGRRYVAVCEHLFIAESSDINAVHICYGVSDIPSVLEFLEANDSLSPVLRATIIQHWNYSTDVTGFKTEVHDTPMPKSDQGMQTQNVADPGDGGCVKDTTGHESIFTRRTYSLDVGKSSERRGQQKQMDYILPKRNDMGRFMGNQESVPETSLYVNHYAFGASAASAASYLHATNKSVDGKVALKAHVAEQLKAFSQAPVQFYWPSFKKKFMEAPRDRCGWCFTCKLSNRKKGCLLNTAAGKLSAGVAIVGGGLRPIKKGANHLSALTAYLLYMEERLNGLLMGPWENSDQRKRWRKRVEHAEHLSHVKSALIELESSLRPLVLSRNWSSYAEDAPNLVSPSALNSTVAVSSVKKTGGRRRKVVQAAQPIKIFVGGGTWGIQWWRGGILTRKFQDWEALPTAVLKRAARQGGAKKIFGLLYSEGLEVPRRTAQCAWRARVESSFMVSELAIQVRQLDALIRWGDLSIPEEVSSCMTSSSVDKSIKDSVIRAKALEGDGFMYLVDSSKPENELRSCLKPHITSCPSKFVEMLLGEGAECRNRVWLPETQLPLCLVRDFEEKWRILMKPGKSGSVRKRTEMPKISKRDRFRVLLKGLHSVEAERKNLQRCEHCDLEMAVSHSVCCENCQGNFHRRCLVAQGKSVSDMCYVCFTISQTKRSRRLTFKALELQKTSAKDFCDTSTGPSGNRETKQLNVYTRRRNLKSPAAPVASNAFGAFVVRKKRSKMHVNVTGVQWKRPEFTTGLTYRRDKLVFAGQESSSEGPGCALCSQPYDPMVLYVGCEHCQEWFHGEALGITESNIVRVAAFKCHKCRKKGSPMCPYGKQNDIARKNAESKENVTPGDVNEGCELGEEACDNGPASINLCKASFTELLSSEDDETVLSEIGNWSGAATGLSTGVNL